MNLDLMDYKEIILHLSLIEGIGPGTIKFLFEKKPQNFLFQDIYKLSIADFKNVFNISENLSRKIKIGLEDKQSLEKELLLIEKHKINWTSFIDNNYPELLKNIHLPPSIIYWQGRALYDSDKKIAMIGSRKANSYAKKVISSLIEPLIFNNWSIVSGGAIGADTMAHESTLNSGGKTIAILGSGLLNPYPISNKKLFRTMLDNDGTIVSSFPLSFPVLPQNFPARNRIISGISKGCVVIQAGIKSGTRITALHALEQGRDVFAIPGPIDDPLSDGCNKLIQEGAKLVINAGDILQEYGENLIEKRISKVNENNIDTVDSQIISLCKHPISIEELSEQVLIEINELQFKLFELQLNGKLHQNFAGLWQKTE